MSSIDEIAEALRRHGSNTVQLLRPGIRRADVLTVARRFGLQFPEDLVGLYCTHDGLHEVALMREGFLLPDMCFLSLAEASDAFEGSLDPLEDGGLAGWTRTAWPVMTGFGFDELVCVCGGTERGCWVQYNIQLDYRYVFRSFSLFASVVLAALDTGIYRLNSEGSFEIPDYDGFANLVTTSGAGVSGYISWAQALERARGLD